MGIIVEVMWGKFDKFELVDLFGVYLLNGFMCDEVIVVEEIKCLLVDEDICVVLVVLDVMWLV